MSFFNTKSILSLVGALLFCVTSFAQLELPRKSPKTSLSYTVGLTTITVGYSSPAVNERTIWGALVPLDKVWRAGANEATTVEFSTDVNIEGKNELSAGKYSLFFIPKEGDKWTAIFNKVTDQWGAYEYNEAEDALRVEVTVKTTKVNQERLEYSIVDQAMDKGYIRFAWEKKRAYIRFKVDVMEKALANIEKALETAPEDQKWGIYGQAADFLSESEAHLDQALAYAEKSTALFEHSWNYWIKAQVQALKGDYKAALASAAKSKEVGMANEKDSFYSESQLVIEQKSGGVEGEELIINSLNC